MAVRNPWGSADVSTTPSHPGRSALSKAGKSTRVSSYPVVCTSPRKSAASLCRASIRRDQRSNVCGSDRDENRCVAAGDDRSPHGFFAALVSCLEIEQRLGICPEGTFDPRCHLPRKRGLAVDEVGQGRPPDSKQFGGLGDRHVLWNDVLSDICAGVDRLLGCSRHGYAFTVAKLKQGAVLPLSRVREARHDDVLRVSWAIPQSKGCGFSTWGRSPLRSPLLHGLASCRQGMPDPSFHIGTVNMLVHHPVVFVEQVYGAAILLELVHMRVGDEGWGLHRRPDSIKPLLPCRFR